MTDILLGSDNDILIVNGQLQLIDSEEVLVRQRLLNRLRSFTGTLFTNTDYGIDVTLLFEKNTQTLLDQHLKTIISNVSGIEELISFESEVSASRVYSATLQYRISTGEIIGIKGLNLSSNFVETVTTLKPLWVNGYWDYSGTWDNDYIFGTDEYSESTFVYLDASPLERFPESLYTAPIFALPRGEAIIDELTVTAVLDNDDAFVTAGSTFFEVSNYIYFELDLLKDISITNTVGGNTIIAFVGFSSDFLNSSEFAVSFDEDNGEYTASINSTPVPITSPVVGVKYKKSEQIVEILLQTSTGLYSDTLDVIANNYSELPISITNACYSRSELEEVSITSSILGLADEMTQDVPDGYVPLLAGFKYSEFIPPTRDLS